MERYTHYPVPSDSEAEVSNLKELEMISRVDMILYLHAPNP